MKSEFWTLGIRRCGAEICGGEVTEGCFSVLPERISRLQGEEEAQAETPSQLRSPKRPRCRDTRHGKLRKGGCKNQHPYPRSPSHTDVNSTSVTDL